MGINENNISEPVGLDEETGALWDEGVRDFLKRDGLSSRIKESKNIEIIVNLTDLGNARRLVSLYKNLIHYCIPWQKWLFWDDQRWKIDTVGEINRYATETIRSIYREASDEKDKDRRAELGAHALKCESQGKIRAMIELAKTEPGIPILPEQMDINPWLLNVANGTLDLRNGELKIHDPQDYITKLAPVPYLPDAQCPTWKTHISLIMNDNTEMIDFLQRSFGYSATGITDERVIFIPWGSGANGKTTTHEAVAAVLGDYSHRAPTDIFTQKQFEPISSDVAALKDRRFVFCSEVEGGKRLKESFVKDIAGGDTIRARFLYSESFEFKPTFKLWLATNHKPIVRGTDNAIWDRIRLIPFIVSIPPKARIPRRDMDLAFKVEAAGILAWIIQGCLNWHKGHGLGMPEAVKVATEEYRQDMDVLGEFLNVCCYISPKVRISSEDLYKAYTEWATKSHEDILKQNVFGRILTERGFMLMREGHGGKPKRIGLCLKEGDAGLPF
jgi:putative DNA primase/helicase